MDATHTSVEFDDTPNTHSCNHLSVLFSSNLRKPTRCLSVRQNLSQKARNGKGEDDVKHIIQIVEVPRTPKVFETAQAQISDLRLRDHEIYGLPEQVDWTDGLWEKYSLIDERISEQVKSEVYVSSDSIMCLGGHCPHHPEAARILEKRSNQMHGGRLALILWASSKTRNGPLLRPTSWIGMGPLAMWGGGPLQKWAPSPPLSNGSFFSVCAAFWRSKKHES